MSLVARKVLTTVFVAVVVFGSGYFAGWYVARQNLGSADITHEQEGHEEDHQQTFTTAKGHEEEHEEHDDEEEHVALTAQAFANLELRLEPLKPQDYWKSHPIPGRVVTIPGRSNLIVSAPVTGLIESIRVTPGQSADPRETLFTMRITDEQLVAAQSKLLDGASRGEVLRREINRLTPLSSSGAIAGRRLRDLRYELAQLDASQEVVRQELRSRGLPEAKVASVSQRRQLASTLAVTADSTSQAALVAKQPQIRAISHERGDTEAIDDATDSHYIVDDIYATTGQSLKRGEPICTLSDHALLQVRGEAFPSDLPFLDRLNQNGWAVTAQFGHDHKSLPVERSLRLLRIDNQIDSESQAVSFYLELPNESMGQVSAASGESFAHWRFKPGQRVHLSVPVEKWEKQLIVPIEAVVREGPDMVVFVEHSHHDEEHDSPPSPTDSNGQVANPVHPDDEIFIELEPIPVHVLHRDDGVAVLANDGRILSSQRVALNGAYELYQAMKAQAAGGGGHHHHHDH